MVCVPVHATVAVGARLATGLVGVQVKPSSAGVSLTVTACSVTSPLLFARTVYVSTCPTVVYLAGLRLSVLVSVSAGFLSAVTVSLAVAVRSEERRVGDVWGNGRLS